MIFIALAFLLLVNVLLYGFIKWYAGLHPVYALMVEPTFWCVSGLFIWQRLSRFYRGGGR